ncbi:hypothetical protein AVEN_88234-1, partial [Araneus ventricosus]
CRTPWKRDRTRGACRAGSEEGISAGDHKGRQAGHVIPCMQGNNTSIITQTATPKIILNHDPID